MEQNEITINHIARDLKILILATSQSEVARRFGYSRSYMNDIVHGRRPVSDELAAKMGYQKVTVSYYIKKG